MTVWTLSKKSSLGEVMWKVYGSLRGAREDPEIFKGMVAIERYEVLRYCEEQHGPIVKPNLDNNKLVIQVGCHIAYSRNHLNMLERVL